MPLKLRNLPTTSMAQVRSIPTTPGTLANPARVPALSFALVTEVEIPPPVYESWSDYVQRSTRKELRERCSQIAVRANRWRLMSGVPIERITGRDVWAVLDAARGRCGTCGSLAVERRPSRPNGAPAPWEAVGRRVWGTSCNGLNKARTPRTT
jgi:hypothetical protein